MNHADSDVTVLAASPAYAGVIADLRTRPRRWLVTGAAGFIGSHLVEALLELDQHVVGLDDLSTGYATNLEVVMRRVGSAAASRWTLHRGDVTRPDDVAAAMRGADVVLHHAALVSVPLSIDDPRRAHDVNATGFLNVLEAARAAGVGRVVYAASSASYGDDPAAKKTEDRLGRPLSMYAATKTANELYAAAYGQAYGMACVGLRYFNVFGSRQDPNGAYAAVIPAWIDQLARGVGCTIHGDGKTTRDFCHVANIVGANLLAATVAVGPDLEPAFNVGTGRAMDLLELYDTIRDAVVAARPDAAWLRTARADHGPFRPGDVRHSQADVSLIRRRLGFEPVVDLAEGIAMTLPWYLQGGPTAAA